MSPTNRSRSFARSLCVSGFTLAKAIGSSTFSWAVRVGIRLNVWKTNPMFESRNFRRSLSESCDVSSLLKNIFPEVGWLNSPIRLRSVVLPEPEGPTIETKVPFSISKFTFFIAVMVEDPNWYVFVRFCVSRINIHTSGFLQV